MATLNEIKRRIAGVKNTQKITRAMKVVATTRLKKYEKMIFESKDFLDIWEEIPAEREECIPPKPKGTIQVSEDRLIGVGFSCWDMIAQVKILTKELSHFEASVKVMPPGFPGSIRYIFIPLIYDIDEVVEYWRCKCKRFL